MIVRREIVRIAKAWSLPLDNAGNWILFWDVDSLRLLESPIRISSLRGSEKPKRYLTEFIPHGPVLIEAPEIA